MDPRKTERRAFRILVFNCALFALTLAFVPWSKAPMNWLLPVGTFCNLMVSLEMWRHHRRTL